MAFTHSSGVDSGSLVQELLATWDVTQWMLSIGRWIQGAPTSVECLKKSEMIDGNFPKSSVVKMKFPAKGDRKPLIFIGTMVVRSQIPHWSRSKITWYWLVFVGDKASIMSADRGDSPRIIPEAKMRETGKPERTLERSVGHHKEFVLAATGKKPIDYPGSNFGC